MDEPAVESLLSEQRRYYSARAPEYDDWWLRRGRYALDPEAEKTWFEDVAALEAALGRFGPAGDVLELAAGTGIWTSRLATHGDRLTAVDASPEVLERNRDRSGPAVDCVVADIFTWDPPRRFDACFFAFWLSHVPRERVAEFWRLVARALRPDGRVFLIDNTHTDGGELRHTVGTGDQVARRSLADGREFDIVKRFWTPAELEGEAAGFGWRLRAGETANGHFLYASGERA